MTINEKIQLINDKLDIINGKILKNKKWKLQYTNKGANNYCITILDNKKELFCSKFETYSGVINCLSLFEFMFNKSLNERKKER